LPTGKRHHRVTLKEILAVHDTALTKGGLPGARDLGAIEAAIARPYSGYYRAISGKAAALVHSLALNHGFVDANKRTSALSCLLLLDKSGYRLSGSPETRNVEIEEMIVAVVEHRMDFDALVAWFKARIVRTDR
jgi:death on curing protein